MSTGQSVGAMVLHADDDVAVLLAPAAAGDTVSTLGARPGVVLRAVAALPAWHKLALHKLPAGAQVRKYGEVIGRLTVPVAAGDYVHVHNLESLRGH